MYRHLLKLEHRHGLACCWNSKLPSTTTTLLRSFSSEGSGGDSKDPKDDGPVSGEKHPKKKFTGVAMRSVVVKLSRDKDGKTVEVAKQAKNKMEALVEKAKSIQSIGPNEKGTISKITGKPKTFVRQSARNPADLPKIEDIEPVAHEPIDVLSSGLDKRLQQAARRVASRMPKHIAKTTEKELIDSIERQKTETEEAKKRFVASRLEDRTQSISYQIMMENRRPRDVTSRPASTAFLENELKERVGSTSEIVGVPRGGGGGYRSQRGGRGYDFENELRERVGSTAEVVGRPRGGGYRNQRGGGGYGFHKDTSLFSGECLNIFDPKGKYENSELNRNPFWEKLQRNEVEMSVHYPAENAFEEMIRWTKQGKLWRYPIDNEQGLDAEAEVPFYEHVLLDNLLDGFPTEGPIRQFMELIIMGLSHNPHITVERKRETVQYYKDFFEERNLFNLETVSVDEGTSESTANA